MKRQPDQEAHSHHATDRADAKDDDVQESDGRRWDRRYDQQHQRSATGQSMDHADDDGTWAEPVVRFFFPSAVSVNVNVLMAVVLVAVNVDLVCLKEFAKS